MPFKSIKQRLAEKRAASSSKKAAVVNAKAAKNETVKATTVVIAKQQYKSTVPRSAYGKGRSMVLKMPYTDTQTLSQIAPTFAGSVYASTMWALNSINVPRMIPIQVTGNFLPQNHNSLQNVFKRYKVLAAKVRLTFTDPSHPMRVVIAAIASDDQFSLGGTFTAADEMKLGTAVRNLDPDDGKSAVFSRYFRIKDLEGLTNAQFNAAIEQYSSVIQSSVGQAIAFEDTAVAGRLPMRKPKLNIGISPMNDQVVAISLNVKCDITYYVRAYEKMTIPTTLSTI